MLYHYSFRAECRRDVDQFLARLAAQGFTICSDITPHGDGFPDVSVNMTTSTGDIEQLRTVMEQIQDSHVMFQTLRPVPLAQNSLERNHAIWPGIKNKNLSGK